MSKTLNQHLAGLVAAAERMRATPIVDDDFPEVMHAFDGELRAARQFLDTPPAPSAAPIFDLAAHLERQRAFSLKTFGPGVRTKGVLAHIRKELAEIERDPGDLSEWVDLILLALDGAWRAGYSPTEIAAGIDHKQGVNERREWPDWRTMDPDGPIEHVRAADPAVLVVHSSRSKGEFDSLLATLGYDANSLEDGNYQLVATFGAGPAGYLLHTAQLLPAAFKDTDPEARMVEEAGDLNCPRCGGSGHVDDGDDVELLQEAATLLGCFPTAGQILDAIQVLQSNTERASHNSCEAQRLLWLAIRTAGSRASEGEGGQVVLHRGDLDRVDWNRAMLERVQDVEGRAVMLRARLRGEG